MKINSNRRAAWAVRSIWAALGSIPPSWRECREAGRQLRDAAHPYLGLRAVRGSVAEVAREALIGWRWTVRSPMGRDCPAVGRAD